MIYKTAEKVEKTEEAEVKEFKPVVYTNQVYPQAYHTPYYYTPKVELKKAEDVESKPIVYTQPMAYANQPMAYAQQPFAYAQQPLTYAHQPTTYAHQPVTYAHQSMTYAHPTQVVYKAAEPVPKYVAKNGEVEHKVFKRDAEADAEAQVYYNTYGSWPMGYAAPATYNTAATYAAPLTYANTPLATSYKYVAPANTPLATSYKYVAPATTAYSYGQAPYVAQAPFAAQAPQYFGRYFL